MKKYLCLSLVLLVTGFSTVSYGETAKDSTSQVNKFITDISGEIDKLITAVKEEQKIETGTLAEKWDAFVANYNKSPLKSPEHDSIVTNATKQIKQGISIIKLGKIKDALVIMDEVNKLISKLPSIQKLPKLMDFTGFRCKNCKIMEKRLNAISGAFKGKTEIIFVDVNKEKNLVRQYKISLIPTLVFLNREGKEVCRKTGVMEEKAIKAKLEELIREGK